jgi:lysophospholipase L1-like esterase
MEKQSSKKSRRNKQFVHISIAFAFVLLLVIMLIEMISSIARQPFDVREGLDVLHQLENADIARIETRIGQLEELDGEAGALAQLSLREFFTGIVVMGDSIAGGLLAYDILNPTSVVATLGAQVTGDLQEDVRRLAELNPRIVFVSYGVNDLLYNNDLEEFIREYGQLLDEIQGALPDTRIFVNGILPPRSDVIGSGIVAQFNEELRQLAYRRQMAFLDNSELIREELYAVDGIHFLPEFYERWAESMRRATQL